MAAHKLKVVHYQPLIQKILHKISGWATKMLSYAGRLQLIKAIVLGVHNYWSQVFLLPHKVVKIIQAACRTFLWTGQANVSRRALVAWEKVMALSAGGLNIVNLKLWNQAAICKLL